MDWEAPRSVLGAAPNGPQRPLLQIDPRELAVHGVLSLPRALAASAAILALLLGLYAVLPTKYAAKAVLTVDPRLSSATDDLTPGIGRDSAAMESLAEVAMTDGFLLGIVRSEKLEGDPEFGSSAGTVGTIEKLRGAMTVDRVGTTYVFEVGVRSKEAEKSARLANAVATALVDRVSEERSAVNTTAARRLADQVASLRGQVAASEKTVADYRSRLGLVDAGRDATAAERSYSDLSRQVADASNALETAKSRLDELSASASPTGGALDVMGSPLLATLRTRASDLRAQIAENLGIFGDRHPQIQRLQDRLAETNQQLSTEGARLKAVARSDYEVARRRYEALAAALAQAKTSVADVGTASADLSALELKAKADRDAYEGALARYQKALAGNDEPAIEMRLSSEALAPIRPTKRTLGFVLPIAAALSLPLGFLAATGASIARRRVRSSSEVEAVLDLPVVGVVPTRRPLGLLTRTLVSDASLDDCAALVGRVALARPGARVLVADVGPATGSAGRIAADIAVILTRVGLKAERAEVNAAPVAQAPDVDRPSRRSWLRKDKATPPEESVSLATSRTADVTLLSLPARVTRDEAREAAGGCDAAVLLVPWNGLSGRDLRLAVNDLIPDPRTPAMVVFTI